MEPTLSIQPAKSSGYPVYVQKGLQAWEDVLLPENIQNRRCVLVTDKSLPRSLIKEFLHSTRRCFPLGLKDKNIIWLKGREKSKSFHKLESAYNQLAAIGVDRKSCLFALGGGVVGDFCGFLAATFLRGIDLIQIPTSLLAAVDSSVGGKTAVNIKYGKNMVGAFYHPRFVYLNINFLHTLPRREWYCGLAEMLKHALLAKSDSVLADLLDSFHLDDLNSQFPNPNDPEFFSALVHSIEVKAEIVEKDEKEEGCRASLNLGHTTAHALESLSKHRRFSHGEAVSRGLVTALLLSRDLIGLDADWLKKFLEKMRRLGLPQDTAGYSAKKLYPHMSYDKKAFQREPRFVLLKERGSVLWDQKISFKDFERAWEEQCRSFG